MDKNILLSAKQASWKELPRRKPVDGYSPPLEPSFRFRQPPIGKCNLRRIKNQIPDPNSSEMLSQGREEGVDEGFATAAGERTPTSVPMLAEKGLLVGLPGFP
ncbi:hypothetical protein BHE74_00038239 [Ensete ventricosum]|nr:hypothetical protein BHE74_00038239 [Ensete ventricosum]RZR98179.1 hypothetical protein BHM03_00027492 [Ensete ventricosum]